MKKVLSIVMAVVLVACCFVPTFAETQQCDRTPILLISGFSQYKHINTRTGKMSWIPDTGILAEAVGKAMPSLTKLLSSNKTREDYDAFCDDVLPIVNGVMDDMMVGPDGVTKKEYVELLDQFTESVDHYDYSHVREVFDNEIVDIVCDAVGKDHVWVYGLDWRNSPLVLADEINEYVEHIKEVTGHEKISIAGISMGGIIMSSYIAKYGYDSLSNITMISSAFTGLDYVGELFSGNVEVDANGLLQIITDSIGDPTLSKVLDKTKILEKLLPIVNDLIRLEKDRIFSECLIPCFGYNPGLWSFVPDKYYNDAKKFMNARMNDGTAEDAKNFWAITDAYHDQVQTKIAGILQQAQKDGVVVSVVSNYNMQMPPVSPASNLTGDQVIETVHTSGFATVAYHGHTLLPYYIKGSRVSADRKINASTCILPDNTWFVRGEQHVGFSKQGENDNGDLYKFLLTAKPGTDVHTNKNFPQFLNYDSKTHTLSPLGYLGDVNGDAVVSVLDAKLILRTTVGTTTLSGARRDAADIDGNGTIGAADAIKVLRMVADA